jgi:two-component system response regulator NreC
MTSIFLADDHAIVRKGLRAVLENESGFIVVGEADNGLTAVEEVERLRPDVLVVDVMMPGLSGLEVTRQVHTRMPHIRILVLSMHEDEPYVLEALRQGASAYLIKASSIDHIVLALQQVLKGHRYLSPPLTERAILAYMQRAASEPTVERYDLLTTREREVLHLLAEGKTHTEIGDRLSISPRTAETHRTNLMRKLGLHSHVDLIKFALKRGIISNG